MKTFIGAFALLSFVGSFAPAARADCDLTGHGVPGVVGPTATDTSITVSWRLLCPIIPSSMQLREGGTTQKNWPAGTLLGTESLAPLENGGAVTASHLMPLTPYLNLRLCAIYSSPEPPWCTASFGASTLGEIGTPIPTFTTASATQTSIYDSCNGNTNYASYNVSYLHSDV